jgi:undecaprenyl-diphosphatase
LYAKVPFTSGLLSALRLALALATAVSAVTAFVSVRWLLRYIETHTFVAFGWYRIALGLALLFAVNS